MNRKKIAAANWKMNTDLQGGLTLLKGLCNQKLDSEVAIVICAPATHLHALNQVQRPENMFLGAQNMHNDESGAYTGEISATMVKSVGCEFVIIGHSERRSYFNESAEFLGKKLRTALKHEITPIFCCGEALEIRKEGRHIPYVLDQLKASFAGIGKEDIKKIVIAYEPIWAIGTGETASPDQAQEMHLAIRDFLADNYGKDTAQLIPILYGGSVKSANAAEIFGKPDVDGGLVGGASLDDEHFAKIVNAFH